MTTPQPLVKNTDETNTDDIMSPVRELSSELLRWQAYKIENQKNIYLYTDHLQTLEKKRDILIASRDMKLSLKATIEEQYDIFNITHNAYTNLVKELHVLNDHPPPSPSQETLCSGKKMSYHNFKTLQKIRLEYNVCRKEYTAFVKKIMPSYSGDICEVTQIQLHEAVDITLRKVERYISNYSMLISRAIQLCNLYDTRDRNADSEINQLIKNISKLDDAVSN